MSSPEQRQVDTSRATPASLPERAQRLPVIVEVTQRRSRRKSHMTLWLLGLLFTAAVGLALYLQPWAIGPLPVVVEFAELTPVTRVLAVNGRIAALHSVDMRALVTGPLTALHVAEGDVLARGAVLAEIDAAPQQAVLRQAVAGLDAALVAQDQTLASYARSLALGANLARTALDAAASAVQAGAQEVARLTALVDQAQIKLADFTLRAPMAGTVLALHVDAGESVDPTTLLMTIADLGQLVVETDVDEAYATQIHPGLPAVLRLTGDATDHAGQVIFVSQRVDAATGGLAIKLGFDVALSAPVGLTVAANIIVEEQNAALTIPRTALRPGESDTAVFVVTDGVARQRTLTVIDWPAARLMVTHGLEPGEAVIIDAAGISDGQAVQMGRP